jgi:membrane-associated phospholipid phosphatase
VGVAALVGLAALVLSLEHWRDIDDAVWRAVLEMRGCATDAAVDRVTDLATHGLTGLLVVAVVRSVRASGLRTVWPWVGTSLLGLLASKTLKQLLTRERPSAIPDVALGFSFPSAHVMNSLVAMLAVMALSAGFRRAVWWRTVAASLTAIVTVGRVVLGRHWVSDVLGGSLAAFVLVGFAVPALARRPVIAPLALGAVLAVGFVVDQRLGASAVRLPTPLIAAHAAVLDVDVGASIRPTLSGTWGETVDDPAVGSFVWLDGAGTVPLDVSDALDLAAPLLLAIGGRSERSLAPCLTLELTLNGHPLRRFVPFRGWREYRFPVLPGLLHAGRNELTISATTRDGPVRFAVVYVRLGTRRASTVVASRRR